MVKKLLFHDKFQIYFYYGIFSKEDYFLTTPVFKILDDHVSSIFPSDENFKYFVDIMELFKPDAKRKSQKVFNNKEHYKLALETYNFGVKDEIVNFIEQKIDTDSNVSFAVKQINNVEIMENDELKKQAQLIVFLMNRKYSTSDLFALHWNDAISLKKEILVFLLEDINVENFDFKNFKVFNVIKTAVKRYDANVEEYEILNEIKSMLQVGFFFKLLLKIQYICRIFTAHHYQ